ncbi:hypothetical protein C8R47DRAFT_1135600 [Mycena vitilis]|nr:hypothetical protein C8R47DRAFT_1135600 [Mycena vitilis]
MADLYNCRNVLNVLPFSEQPTVDKSNEFKLTVAFTYSPSNSRPIRLTTNCSNGFSLCNSPRLQRTVIVLEVPGIRVVSYLCLGNLTVMPAWRALSPATATVTRHLIPDPLMFRRFSGASRWRMRTHGTRCALQGVRESAQHCGTWLPPWRETHELVHQAATYPTWSGAAVEALPVHLNPRRLSIGFISSSSQSQLRIQCLKEPTHSQIRGIPRPLTCCLS